MRVGTTLTLWALGDHPPLRVRILVDAGFADLPTSATHVIEQPSRSSTRLKIPADLLAEVMDELAS